MADAQDFLAVDDLLSEEDRAIRDTVRAFGHNELRPHVAEWYEHGTLPDDLGPRLGKLGLLGMHLEGYGCAGTSATAYGVACRELEAVDSGLRSFVSVQELNRYRKEVTALVAARVAPPATPDPQAA